MGAGSSGSTVPGFVGCTLKRRAMAFFFFTFYKDRLDYCVGS